MYGTICDLLVTNEMLYSYFGNFFRIKDTKENDDHSSKTTKDPNGEAEPWIQVTEEDVAQAKQATGNENENEPEVAC